ncbi:MAG: N-acetylmuramoyl-L-alanine amidase [Prevotella sp.]
MSYILKTLLSNRGNYGGSRTAAQIKYIVMHFTANDGDSDTGNANYFHNNVVKASAHYFVDDDSVTQSVSDLSVAWSVGGKKWSDCVSTGGGKMYGKITNTNSISIEMCDTLKNGTLQATEATMANAAALCRVLMEKYNVPLSRVVRHFDVTGKHCPSYFMDKTAWATWKERLVDKDMTATDAEKIIKEKTGASDAFVRHIWNYRWGDEGLILLAKAMK